jgi:hypothetical protein
MLSQNSESRLCDSVSVKGLFVIDEGQNFGYFLIGNFHLTKILDDPRQLVPGSEAVVLC